MSQKDNIEDLARKPGIDSEGSSSQLDRSKRTADAVGTKHYDGVSNADTDDLEARSKEKNKEIIEDDDNEEEVKGKVTGILKKNPIFKIIAIISGASSFVSLLLFIVIFIAPLISLGIIDIGDLGGGIGGSSSLSYSDIGNSSSYWWPIGGSEITVIDGKEYATGSPTCTYISSNFGLRELDNTSDNHSGMDISCAPSNEHNVIATLSGTVETVVNAYQEGRNQAAGYGNYVKIKHDNGDSTIYAHMYLNSIKVSVGDEVKQGQVLGKMGNSGDSTGTHLHFEIRSGGTAVDPANYISSDNPRPESSRVNYIDGSSNKQSVCLTLKANGFSTNGTIALMTNINHESGFDYTAYNANDNGGPSYGLCQWHNERYTNLQNSYPNNYNTIGGQIQYLMYELENGYSGLYNNLLEGSLTPSELTYQFCKNFERPADAENSCRARSNNAVNFTEYVINNCQ